MHEAILHCHGVKTWKSRWANGDLIHMVRAHGYLDLPDGTTKRGPFAVKQPLPIDYGDWNVTYHHREFLGGNGIEIVSIHPVWVSK